MKLKYFILLPLFWFFIHSIYIIWDGFNDKGQTADIAVVFGNKVNIDGSLSERLKARLDQSIAIYKTGRVEKILVSGGYGKEGFWEGSEMKKYLIENKIPSEKILVDNFGDDTEKTVVNTIKIMDSLHYKKLISVSQYYHQSRIKKFFREHLFYNVYTSSPRYFEMRDFYSVFREFFAFYFG
ncbi:YdcF family protein [Epilithonimonas caeni]|uniref:YdcF family protein n=1 Tax=Epilithonimonas caeni TaxID=365343 RepID=UPI0003FBA67D|nr:YdcF family protein [Epilithonimonas caeni]